MRFEKNQSVEGKPKRGEAVAFGWTWGSPLWNVLVDPTGRQGCRGRNFRGTLAIRKSAGMATSFGVLAADEHEFNLHEKC